MTGKLTFWMNDVFSALAPSFCQSNLFILARLLTGYPDRLASFSAPVRHAQENAGRSQACNRTSRPPTRIRSGPRQAFHVRVMIISCFSASRRNRERSSLIADKGTSFIRAFRTAPAILPPPIWEQQPRPQRTRPLHRKILEPPRREVEIAVAYLLANEKYVSTIQDHRLPRHKIAVRGTEKTSVPIKSSGVSSRLIERALSSSSVKSFGAGGRARGAKSRTPWVRGAVRRGCLNPMVRVSAAIVKEVYHSPHASRSNTTRFRRFPRAPLLDNQGRSEQNILAV